MFFVFHDLLAVKRSSLLPRIWLSKAAICITSKNATLECTTVKQTDGFFMLWMVFQKEIEFATY